MAPDHFRSKAESRLAAPRIVSIVTDHRRHEPSHAGTVEVEIEVRARDHRLRQRVRDGLGRTSARVSWKHACQVAPIERTRARPVPKGRRIRDRNGEKVAVHLVGVDLLERVEDRLDPLELISVNAGRYDQRRARPSATSQQDRQLDVVPVGIQIQR